MGNEVAKKEETGLLVETNKNMVARLQERVNLIQDVYHSIMKDKSDFGKIPGCGDKPTLLKPGAEKLLLAFRVAPSIKVSMREYDGGHREYEIITTLTASDGTILGEGVGCCSTMESKYRYRTGPKEFTGKPVPADYWKNWKTDPPKALEIIGGKGFSVGKNDDGAWEICIRGEKAENQDPADQYNTVLKMSKKRSLIDACLTVFGASDIFTQDVEDGQPETPVKPQADAKAEKPAAPAHKAAPANSPAPAAPALKSLELYNKRRAAAQDSGHGRDFDKVADDYLRDTLGKDLADCTEAEIDGLNKHMVEAIARRKAAA